MRLFVCLAALLLSGCLGGDAGSEPDEDPPSLDDDPGTAEQAAGGGGATAAADAFEPTVVFEGRLAATGLGADAEAEFEVPEGARRVEVQALGPDDLAVGRFGLTLEAPSGDAWEVYAAYGYRSPVNAVVVEFGDETLGVRAAPGTWSLRLETDGSADLGVVVTAS